MSGRIRRKRLTASLGRGQMARSRRIVRNRKYIRAWLRDEVQRKAEAAQEPDTSTHQQ